jgi:hypothetical protein
MKGDSIEMGDIARGICGIARMFSTESLILAQDERWRRA